MTRKCVVLAVLALVYPLALAQDAVEEAVEEPAVEESAVEEPVTKAEPFVVTCKIDGMIDKGVAVLVKRAVAEAAGAEALVFEVDTFGGLVDVAIDISNYILDADCQVIALATGKGMVSAGAVIGYACDDILMAPGTTLGTSAPVNQTSEGMAPSGEKVVSLVRAKIAALAEHRGHNPAIAKAMVDQDIELRKVLRPDGFYDVYEADGDGRRTTRDAGPAEKMVDAIAEETSIPLDSVKELARDLDTEIQGDDSTEESKAQEPRADWSWHEGSFSRSPRTRRSSIRSSRPRPRMWTRSLICTLSARRFGMRSCPPWRSGCSAS
jgi:ATP-dependent protease ClpP protease subunit